MSEIFFNDGGTPRSLGHTADPQLPGKVSELEGRVEALEGVTPYVLPPASVSSLGGVKVDGTSITAAEDGTISATLSDAVDSDSGTTAASSKAVKTAYDAAIFAQKQVKTKLTQPTTFYVNGETGNDALDEGRGLSESKPFRTAQAAVNHICGAYDLQNQTCYLQLSQGDYPDLVIPDFSTTTGQFRIRGAGADRTKILGSVIFYHSASTVALESSLCVKCPNAPTPGWTNVWYGLATFAMGGVDVVCTIDAGEENPDLYKYLLASSQSCKGFSLYGCTLKGACTQFLSASGGAINILDDLSMNGKIVGNGAIAVAVTGGRIIVTSKADGVSLPVINGSVEGRRYAAHSGGGISVGGQGPNYFPGTEAGIVDTSTGAYYG